MEEESSGGESEQQCNMVQGNNSLEVNSKTHLDDSVTSSGDEYVDADALNEELSIICEKLLEKYKALKKGRVLNLTKKMKTCAQNLI